MKEKKYRLESKTGYRWWVDIVDKGDCVFIDHSTILMEYAGADEDISPEESVAIDTLESFILSLAGTGIDGFEDKIIDAVNTTLAAIATNYGP